MSTTQSDPPDGASECMPEIDLATRREFRLINRKKHNNFIWGELTGGVLAFIVSNRPKDGTGCPGRWMFGEMMTHFAASVVAIRGSWTYGDNLATVNRLTASGVPFEAAAAQTWTGRRAAECGYSSIQVVSTTGTPGAYSNVQVLFQP
jgi:hypothetical protein